MHPVEFPEMNTTYTAPGCKDLPVARFDKDIVSCWQLSDEERKQIADGGKIWLVIQGIQPPVMLFTSCPILDQQEWPEEVQSNG